MIFSVMASPNRIDILRILNSKGPLTYSELKSLAGFRSKKESGKFAYHLRKLLRQSLVGLNKAERRYAITNLGKLVLNLARQIEEKSIVESGKMYVRTSNQTIEEFNPHKIIQCLVREANMSLEQSTKITEEVENKIYKFPTSYLTSRLIRDCVNNVLLEHGLEEPMNKLIRLGIPIYDLNKKLNNSDNDGLYSKSINDISLYVSKQVFSDYLKNNFPKDVLDMHLGGEIHLNNLEYWGIYPDTVFIDMENYMQKDINFNNTFLNLPRVLKLDNVDMVMPLLISVLQKEVAKEIVIENFEKLFEGFSLDAISTNLANLLTFSSFSFHSLNCPSITLAIDTKNNNDYDYNILQQILKGYLAYVEKVPISKFGIFISVPNSSSLGNDLLSLVLKIIGIGGKVSLSTKPLRSSKGVFKIYGGNDSKVGSLPIVSLHSISLNLPRLAYQSNKDETYFRTKLALLLKPSLDAALLKKDMLFDNLRKGLLPSMSSLLDFPQTGFTNMVINFTGLNESVYNILEHDNNDEYVEIVKKVINTSNEVVADFGNKRHNNFGISIINDGSAERFFSLDSEKFGKYSRNFSSYSQGLTITPNDVYKENFIVHYLNTLDNLLTGGFYVKLDITPITNYDLVDLLSKSIDMIPYFDVFSKYSVCNICGSKIMGSTSSCPTCKSNNLISL
jgi:hypothetical protein